MDHTRVRVITTVLLVLIGSVPIRSEKCTPAAFKRCMNIPGLFGCKLFQDMQECLEKIDHDCTDNIVMEQLTARLKFVRENGEVCPGLADGECFHTAWLECKQHLPSMNIYNIVTKGLAEKEEKCGEFTSKMTALKKCATELKPKCDSPQAKILMDQYVNWSDKNMKLCVQS